MILKAPMIETLIDKIKKIVSKSLIKINKRYKINNFSILKNKFLIEKTKNIQFGNLSTNIAMIAKINGKTQMEISKLIKKYINHKSKYFTKIEIKKPGGKLKPMQEKWRDECEQLHIIWTCTDSLSSFKNFITLIRG